MSIDLIVFDVDGVLVNTLSQTYAVDCAIIGKRGLNIPSMQEYRDNPHRGRWTDFYAFFGVTDGEAALKEYYDSFILEDTSAVPNVAETLQNPSIIRIERVIASLNRDKQRVIQKLTFAQLMQYFHEDDIYVTQGDKTDLLLKICEEYLVVVNKSCFVSDTANDIHAGNKAGLITVGVANQWSNDSYHILQQAEHLPLGRFFCSPQHLSTPAIRAYPRSALSKK